MSKNKLKIFIAIFALLFFKQTAFSTELDLSVTVPSKATDFELAVSSDASAAVNQYETITYEITYGSNLDYADSLEIQAEWSQGTIEGESTPTVDVAEYVISSATNAYNSTPAVIDLVNRTITWNISSFPANTTNQTVSFQLKTTANYTGSKQVAFTISSRLTNDDMTTSDKTVTNYYEYDSSITPSPTPSPTPTPTPIASPTSTPTPTTSPTSSITPTPTAGPTATTTPSPTPTTTPKAAVFEEITIRSLTSDTVRIYSRTNQETTAKIFYEEKIYNLSSSQTSLSLLSEHEFLIEELKPETVYYFKITVTNKNKLSSTSDIFTFKTPALSKLPEVENQSVIITSNNNVLASPVIEGLSVKQPNATVVIPKNTVYEFKFALKKYQKLKEIKAVLRSKNVLGVSTFTEVADASIILTNITEIEAGVFVGKLKSPSQPGTYEIIARIIDTNGNITEQKIADIKVSKPLSVFDQNNNPIEAARLLLYLYNIRTGEFKQISQDNMPIKNPSFSNSKGEFPVVLPNGIYKAEVLAIGHEKTSQNFVLSFQGGNDYPQLKLKNQGFNLLTIIEYYWAALNDFLAVTASYITQVTASVRFFQLTSVFIIITSIALSWLSISLRAHIPLIYLYWYPFSEIKNKLTKLKFNKYYYGIVTEENGFGQSKALVYLIDADKNKIISKTMTNYLGEFFLKKSPAKNYKILVSKNGFEIKPFFEYSFESLEKGEKLVLSINRLDQPKNSFVNFLEQLFEKTAELSFSTLLTISLVFEILLAVEYGMDKSIPFIVISVLNIYLWSFYFHPKNKD